MAILDLIVPVFAVMVTGYVFARLGFLSEEVGTALIQFVFKVSVPALLFLAIAQENFDNLFNWPIIAAFGGVTVAVFVLILFGDRYVFKAESGPATMMATICVGIEYGHHRAAVAAFAVRQIGRLARGDRQHHHRDAVSGPDSPA